MPKLSPRTRPGASESAGRRRRSCGILKVSVMSGLPSRHLLEDAFPDAGVFVPPPVELHAFIAGVPKSAAQAEVVPHWMDPQLQDWSCSAAKVATSTEQTAPSRRG